MTDQGISVISGGVMTSSPSSSPTPVEQPEGIDNAGMDIWVKRDGDSPVKNGTANGDVKTPTTTPVHRVEFDKLQHKVTVIPEGFNNRPPKKHKEPLAWCKFIVKRPKTAFAITLAGNLSFFFITAILVVSGQSVFPTVFTDLPLQLKDDNYWLRCLAWQAKDENFTRYVHDVDSFGVSGIRTEMNEEIGLVYEVPGGNVFSKEHLQAIRDLEDELIAVDGHADYCQLDAVGECVKPISIVRFFDGTYAAINPVFNDTEFDNIPAVLEAANSLATLGAQLQFHLGKDEVIDAANNIATSSITRSIIPHGLPLSEEDAMEKELSAFVSSTYESRLAELHSNGYRGIEILYFSRMLWNNALDNQVQKDMVLVVGSIVFIFSFIWFQTKSLWITGFSVLGILTSFFGSNLIYRYVLDYQFFGIFHILAIFIILGIGADDLFVFIDTWRATGFEDYPGLEYRLSDAYRRASGTMLVTSLTTAIAFFVNAMSPLLGVNTFGIFAGILVLFNYVTVVVYVPTVIMTYHLYWRDYVLCCCRPCIKRPTITESREDLDDKQPKKKNVVVRFFAGRYYRFVTHKVIRWFILIFFAALVAGFGYSASTLGPQEEAIQVFKDGNNFVEYPKKAREAFKPSNTGNNIAVTIVWGLKNQDLSRCHQTAYECTGDTVWDDSFDLNPLPSQAALLEFCDRLRNLTDEENEELHVQRDFLTGEFEVECFIESMSTYYENLTQPNGTDWRLPLSESKMRSLMDANPTVFDTSQLHDTYYRYFETGVGFWLTQEYNGDANLDNEAFQQYIGEEEDRRDTLDIVSGDDKYGTRLRYAAITVTTSLAYGTIGYENGMPIVDAWEKFVTNEMGKMPPSVANGYQCTCDGIFNLWHWIKVQKTLADSAIRGIIYGIAFAFPILVIATQNIILGTMATMSIALTTICVVGVIPLAGWKLGLLESLNLSIIVGLAVDYVVHLAEGYHLSPKQDRLGRLQDMLEYVAVSVVSGAATTLGASLFMLFAQIIFFMQFGIFMFATIGFSLVFSLGMFTTLLGIMGPQGQTGSLVIPYNWIIGRKKDDIDCAKCEGKGFHDPLATNMRTIAVSPINSPVTSPVLRQRQPNSNHT